MTTLAALRDASAPIVPARAITPGFESMEGFEALQRIAKVFNQSSMVPDQFRGPANFANAVIAIEMALRMGANPFQMLQNIYIVHGRPGLSSQFLIACFNRSGRYSSLRYEFSGELGTDGYGCRAVATELATGEKLTGTVVTIATAKKEGWFGKSGSKWLTMPDQMLRYRAAAWFIRTHAPEIALGMQTTDELQDVYASEHAPRPVQVVAVEEEAPAPAPTPTPAPKTTRKRSSKKPPFGSAEDAQITEVTFPDPEPDAEPAPQPEQHPAPAPEVDYIYELEDQLFGEGVSAEAVIAEYRKVPGVGDSASDEEIAKSLCSNVDSRERVIASLKERMASANN